MNIVGKFEKVSYEQFKKDMLNTFEGLFNEEEIKRIYDEIKLPQRATKGSAGYDFYSPVGFALTPHTGIKIPTGIRVKIRDDWFLACVPRSSMGFKYRMQIDNTMPVIDSDYYHADNEGHIFIKISCDSYKDVSIDIKEGDAFVQGIFLPYGLAQDDNTTEVRTGGIGSTTK